MDYVVIRIRRPRVTDYAVKSTKTGRIVLVTHDYAYACDTARSYNGEYGEQ